MPTRYILSEHVEQAMSETIYDKLEDGTFTGRITSCKEVLSFGITLRECENELRSIIVQRVKLNDSRDGCPTFVCGFRLYFPVLLL